MLAENTYRFGFHGITAGSWLADKLAAEYGMRTDAFGFGADLSHYSLTRTDDRDDVFFYARPVTSQPRFRARRHGSPARGAGAGRPDHPPGRLGHLRLRSALPSTSTMRRCGSRDLNELYNQCAVGLVLSLTNMSLLPLELLASGMIPVLNRGPNNDKVVQNDFIRYADPSPHALASAVLEELDRPDRADQTGAGPLPASRTCPGTVRAAPSSTSSWRRCVARCLVIGGNGFIGSHVVDSLEARGHAVTVFDRHRRGPRRFDGRPVEVIQGDFLNAADVQRALEGQDIVLHMLSLTDPATAEGDPTLDIRTNITSSVQLFAACAAAGVGRVYFASSGGAIYGDQDRQVFRETDVTLPGLAVRHRQAGDRELPAVLPAHARPRVDDLPDLQPLRAAAEPDEAAGRDPDLPAKGSPRGSR